MQFAFCKMASRLLCRAFFSVHSARTTSPELFGSQGFRFATKATHTPRKMEIHHPARLGVEEPLSQEYEELFTWALSQGVRWNNLRYPVRFPPGYYGVQTTSFIGPNETIISVPKHLIIAAREINNTELGPMLEAHPELFQQYKHSWWEDFRLILFLLMEEDKGRLSKWHVYLRTLPRAVDSTVVWSDAELSLLQDETLVSESKDRRARLHSYWTELRQVALQYPGLFREDMLTFDRFIWAQFIVTSRTFGKSVPSTCLCPIAELVNHQRSQTYYVYGREGKLLYQKGEDWDDDDWPTGFETPCMSMLATVVKAANGPLGREADSYLTTAAWDRDMAADSESAKHRWRPLKFTESPTDALRIVSGPTESYSPGAEIYLNYGSRSNRSLLVYYGFALDQDELRYDFVHVTVADYLGEREMKAAKDSGCADVWTFKVRGNRLCDSLLAALRSLLWKPTAHSLKNALTEEDTNLEVSVVTAAISVIEKRLQQYPTTEVEDEARLRQVEALREYFAVQYRRQRKAALREQCKLLSELKNRLETGAGR